jgi:hypothetical protein
MSQQIHACSNVEKEKKEGEAKDPILRFKKELISEGRLTEEGYREIEQRAKREVEEAIHFAEKVRGFESAARRGGDGAGLVLGGLGAGTERRWRGTGRDLAPRC